MEELFFTCEGPAASRASRCPSFAMRGPFSPVARRHSLRFEDLLVNME